MLGGFSFTGVSIVKQPFSVTGRFARVVARGTATRCTAVLVASMMILSVYMPHGVYDEEDESARA